MTIAVQHNIDYFASARWDLFSLVDGVGNRVLELGCGLGKTGALLKKYDKAAEVVGLELDPETARSARSNIDLVICGDLEDPNLSFGDSYYDYVLAGDILEHLVDPWTVLRRILFNLKPGGYVIASIPNVRHWRVLFDLIFRDSWEYSDEGLLDRTHVRFFTRTTIVRMFLEAGYEIGLVCPAFQFARKSKSAIFNRISMGIVESFSARQYLVKARRPLTPGLLGK